MCPGEQGVHPFSTKRYLELMENESTGTTNEKNSLFVYFGRKSIFE
jgi:hypothetical protein